MSYFSFMCDMTGYSPKTTFWMDFSIADKFGKDAVEDTYNRAFREWKSHCEYITELVMVLNWKSWEHSELGNDELAELYVKLFYKAREWCFDNLKDDELRYFIETTD